ncbi:hypothetical protein M0R45_014113 [Rubus argutus]|uniref:Nucleoprotein TPR/MLP1 domain-containing protein n=1 Tax=Rubus argutus TaxID=59490 RepID=A0AAW1XL97_RUBAR
MPLFVSDEEFSSHRDDAAWVAEKADAFIRNLYTELDTVRAQNDAASITAEQTCSLLEQKYLSLSDEYSKLGSELAQLKSSFDERLSELAEVQAQKYQLNLQSINKDSEIEMLKTEVSELHKSKRQLMEIVEQKDEDISEKNVTIKSYLDKIVKLSENAAQREARLSEAEAELARTKDSCTHLSQEKELIERHNGWLNDELADKVDSLIKLRRMHADVEAEMSFKLADVERKFNDCSSSLNWNKERVRELEAKLSSLQEELCSSKDAAAANEERSNAELSTVNKLVELYKESSEEWSKKAGELEGVIKALETHLNQVENDYKERLERELSARNQFEKEAADLKTKLEKCEAEIEASRKANELSLLPLNSSSKEMWLNSLESADMAEINCAVVPKIPVGVSGTALAASLLRDGWSLAKMYAKYQEAVDALRHEQLGRKESEAILQRVLYEIEEKAEVIMDERVEHERMAEAYSMINQKLQDSLSEQEYLERTITELKADIRRHERDYSFAQKEIADLQREVTVLLKECRDIQLRGSSSGHDTYDNAVMVHAESDAENVISEHLLTFKDINGLVQQNAQLRSLVRNLSDQLESREKEFKEKFEMELKKHTEEAASRVEAVLQRAEEQGQMIESLHTSVAMYKRLYEEEHKLHSTSPHIVESVPEERRSDIRHLLESSQEASRKAQDHAAERVKCLEEDLVKTRSEIISLRSERDKFNSEANVAREKLESFMKEVERQRNETNAVLARNIEFSQIIVDYQRKLREGSESVQTAEELSRKLTLEVALLKQGKEMLQHAEKRASDEVRSLSERVYRLQASLDTIQSTQQVREEARAAERRKQEEYTKQKEREWADAKRELQEEKNNALTLALDRDQTIKNAIKQVDEMRKDLSNALHAAASAENRAAVAEARLTDLEKKSSSTDIQVVEIDGGSGSASLTGNEAVVALRAAKDEIENLKDEMQANKDHMLQYKSIAQVNEDALKQMEFAHENFKIEAEKLKKSLDAELLSLRERVSELENEIVLKSQEVASAAAGKEEALSSALAEISSLKEETSAKTSQIAALEIQVSTLKEDLEKEHQRWRAAQANYERQVILQSETIQELTKTSQALAMLQEEASELRRLADALKSENDELKSKWEVDKAILEESTSIADKKYNEINEQNKILHSQLEALHIQLAERDRGSFGTTSASTGADTSGDTGLQTVISYLRRTKEIAETEISLLKQEKLRLQSQLESALKASETAQASLRAERASSRSMLFSEEELKSLQLQVREINLLRESNIQLREENKHNFEECQRKEEVISGIYLRVLRYVNIDIIQEASRKAQDHAAERVKCLEEDLVKTRSEIISLRSERDKFNSEANVAREKLESFMKEVERQRNETNAVLARNIEFSQIIVDYQRKLREGSESVQTAEELSRKLTLEVALLKQGKEMLQHAEKRASDEVRSLSERVYRLQASLDTIQSTQQVREEARAAERRKQEEYTKQKEREWADAKRELQEEKNNALTLALDRDQTIKNAIKQVDEMRKDLSNALHAAASAENRAAVAEARLTDLEKKSSSTDIQVVEIDGGSGSASLTGNEAVVALRAAKDEIENLKDEMQTNKDHMLQYKSIAQVNEDALKQMEFAHENFKIEAEKLKKSLDAELLSLRERVSELENEIVLKSQEVASAAAGKEEALSSALAEISSLKEETSAKTSQIAALEIQVSTLKEDLEKEHQRWRAAQANYERQVILQSETIQELTKTSQALAMLQEEASELRRLADALKSENDELKSKWEVDKAILEESTSIADKKYNEINEQNKILHSQLEALHIQLAERDRGSFGTTSASTGADTSGDTGLQTVISYLRRTKEIAETEISLLKQEKLRLQSQLESALKASETAQASLRAERASSRSMLFSEEELKSLQLQVREINLLRESNIQLREENKHNFEECQKLHEISQKASVERHNLERLLRDRQIEVEACKKEIEMQKMEKDHLEKRLGELLERYINIDVEDYDRTKAEHQQMQVTLKEKDSHIEEIKKLLSEKLEIVTSLEQDLSNCRLELTGRDKRINDFLQAEASSRSDVEKQKRMTIQFKRKYETCLKEKEDLQRQRDDLQKQCEDLLRQRDDLSRQLEETKQVKRSSGDTEEKDQKIQTLQKIMERQKEAMEKQKEDLRIEKAKRQRIENAATGSLNKFEQDKIMLKNELEKHKQAVKQLADVQEKLKKQKDGLPEGTSVDQYLSGAVLDDRASAYFLSCENYERVVHSISNDPGSGVVPVDTPVADASLATPSAPAQAATLASSMTRAAVLPSKATEETERTSTLPKKSIEPRKTGRKLVRPRLVRPEEPQGDVEMSEMEGAHTLNKHAASSDTEVQGIVTSTQPLLRKRQASSSQFESHEESVNQVETGPDVAAPVSKKPKGSDSPLRTEGQISALLENLGNVPVTEEAFNADFPQGSNEEGAVDAEKEEIDNTVGKVEEHIERQFDGSSQAESQHDGAKFSVMEEDVDGSDGKEMVPDDAAKENQVEPDNQQSSEFGGDREEGELLPDVSDLEGGDTTMGSPGIEEGQPEPITTPRASPSKADDEDLAAAASVVDTGEVNSPEVLNDEKSNEVDVPEETAEGSDKSNDEVGVSKQGSPGVTAEVEEAKQVSPTPTTINITEQARRKAMLRQRGLQQIVVHPTPNRGRGRPPQRARGVRRSVRGRGSTSGDQV